MALTFSFAAFDWMMSLEPLWFSTIFGVYYFAGSFRQRHLAAGDHHRSRSRQEPLRRSGHDEHIHNLGKLMLAFTGFWAYIGFSQFLLIWIAGLPEEVPFYIVRMKGDWAGHRRVPDRRPLRAPFVALLSRSLKRNRARLALVAFWILLVHAVDLYWLIMPTLARTAAPFHWTLITAFVGVGGMAVAFALWRIRGHFTVPVRDPYLADSLAYRQP